MVIELILVGIFIGTMSGFFGIGGGMILVPILLVLGIDTKEAIGISIIQMVFTSIYGSYLNQKRGTLIIREGIFIGLAGFIGGYIGAYTTQFIPDYILHILFFMLLIFSLFRLFFSPNYEDESSQNSINKWLLFAIGLVIGIFAISLGIGGSIVLTPILVGVLHYPLKKAISAGLFFVAFSSISGLVSMLTVGSLDYHKGVIVGIASLIGVAIGIALKEHISTKNHKTLLIILYLFAIAMLTKRVLF